jgi:hypothetical protein
LNRDKSTSDEDLKSMLWTIPGVVLITKTFFEFVYVMFQVSSISWSHLDLWNNADTSPHVQHPIDQPRPMRKAQTQTDKKSEDRIVSSMECFYVLSMIGTGSPGPIGLTRLDAIDTGASADLFPLTPQLC